MSTAELTHVTAGRAAALPTARDRGFWLGLAGAVALHAALIVGVGRYAPRTIGDPSGSRDAISVVIVDEADLASRETVPMPADTPPADPAGVGEPPRAQSPPPVAPAAEATPQPLPAPQPAPPEKELPDLPTYPAPQQQQPAPPQQKPQPKPQAQPKPRTADVAPPKPRPQAAPLDLSPPPGMLQAPVMPSGRNAAFARPPGITRSGENDDFGRGVIRALRQTMPRLDVRGRVTVWILLTQSGNLADVRLLRTSGDAALDQSVMFAVKQSSFPFPPARAPEVDRTFIVTYIYG